VSGDDDRTPAVPGDLKPAVMEVGYNYTWAFNRYGTHIGPRDIEHDPPTGVNDAMPVWLEPRPTAPKGTLERNLVTLRDQLNIRKVRMFLLGNAFNYGGHPQPNPSGSGPQVFTAPATAHPLFVDHFTKMLEVFRRTEMQILPSLIDFGAFYPAGPGSSGGGRRDILFSQRTAFLTGLVEPLVKASVPFRSSVFAWEVVNEPVWNTISAPFFGRPHTRSSGPDCDKQLMGGFVLACTTIFQNNGFESTVGHRFHNDLFTPMGTGTKAQYHYYGATSVGRFLGGVNDPKPIPDFTDPSSKQAFIGELGTAPGGDKNQFGDEEPGSPWDECNGRDTTRLAASFERLAVLARKGYKLAFVWPDRSDKEPGVVNDDELKLSSDVQASIKRFTTGRFKNGVP
jgi:hypothetical protein